MSSTSSESDSGEQPSDNNICGRIFSQKLVSGGILHQNSRKRYIPVCTKLKNVFTLQSKHVFSWRFLKRPGDGDTNIAQRSLLKCSSFIYLINFIPTVQGIENDNNKDGCKRKET